MPVVSRVASSGIRPGLRVVSRSYARVTALDVPKRVVLRYLNASTSIPDAGALITRDMPRDVIAVGVSSQIIPQLPSLQGN